MRGIRADLDLNLRNGTRPSPQVRESNCRAAADRKKGGIKIIPFKTVVKSRSLPLGVDQITCSSNVVVHKFLQKSEYLSGKNLKSTGVNLREVTSLLRSRFGPNK